MKIKPTTYIRNEYAELSSYCKETAEPVYITKNGEGDLVVMSVDAYEDLKNRLNDAEERAYYLSKLIEADEYNKDNPDTYTLEETMERARAKINECGQIK